MKKKMKQVIASFMFACFVLVFAGCHTVSTGFSRGHTAFYNAIMK